MSLMEMLGLIIVILIGLFAAVGLIIGFFIWKLGPSTKKAAKKAANPAKRTFGDRMKSFGAHMRLLPWLRNFVATVAFIIIVSVILALCGVPIGQWYLSKPFWAGLIVIITMFVVAGICEEAHIKWNNGYVWAIGLTCAVVVCFPIYWFVFADHSKPEAAKQTTSVTPETVGDVEIETSTKSTNPDLDALIKIKELEKAAEEARRDAAKAQQAAAEATMKAAAAAPRRPRLDTSSAEVDVMQAGVRMMTTDSWTPAVQCRVPLPVESGIYRLWWYPEALPEGVYIQIRADWDDKRIKHYPPTCEEDTKDFDADGAPIPQVLQFRLIGDTKESVKVSCVYKKNTLRMVSK